MASKFNKKRIVTNVDVKSLMLDSVKKSSDFSNKQETPVEQQQNAPVEKESENVQAQQVEEHKEQALAVETTAVNPVAEEVEVKSEVVETIEQPKEGKPAAKQETAVKEEPQPQKPQAKRGRPKKVQEEPVKKAKVYEEGNYTEEEKQERRKQMVKTLTCCDDVRCDAPTMISTENMEHLRLLSKAIGSKMKITQFINGLVTNFIDQYGYEIQELEAYAKELEANRNKFGL